jgi:hypothetical protein
MTGTPIRINFENIEPFAEAHAEIEREVAHLQKIHPILPIAA